MGHYFLTSLIIVLVQLLLLVIWFYVPLIGLIDNPNLIHNLVFLIPLYIPVLSILGIIFSIVSLIKKERGIPILAGLLNLGILMFLIYVVIVAIYSGI